MRDLLGATHFSLPVWNHPASSIQCRTGLTKGEPPFFDSLLMLSEYMCVRKTCVAGGQTCCRHLSRKPSMVLVDPVPIIWLFTGRFATKTLRHFDQEEPAHRPGWRGCSWCTLPGLQAFLPVLSRNSYLPRFPADAFMNVPWHRAKHGIPKRPTPCFASESTWASGYVSKGAARPSKMKWLCFWFAFQPNLQMDTLFKPMCIYIYIYISADPCS